MAGLSRDEALQRPYYTAWKVAENLTFATSGLAPLNHSRAVTAALEALRHPKSEFFRKL